MASLAVQRWSKIGNKGEASELLYTIGAEAARINSTCSGSPGATDLKRLLILSSNSAARRRFCEVTMQLSQNDKREPSRLDSSFDCQPIVANLPPAPPEIGVKGKCLISVDPHWAHGGKPHDGRQ